MTRLLPCVLVLLAAGCGARPAAPAEPAWRAPAAQAQTALAAGDRARGLDRLRAAAALAADLPATHPERWSAARTLAAVLAEGGAAAELDEAEAVLRRMLAGGAPTDPASADHRLALVRLVAGRGRLDEAEKLLREHLRLQEQHRGAQHAETALAAALLAESLRAQDHAAEAATLYRRALAIWDGHGQAGPETAAALHGLALVDGPAAASGHLQRAVMVLTKAVGADHPALLPVLDSQARLAAQDGRWAEAIAAGERILAILAKTGGTDQRAYVAALDAQVRACAAAGRRTEAIAHGRNACVIIERALGSRDPNLAVALANVAYLLRQGEAAAEREEAERLEQRAAAIGASAAVN
jgi:tetratricopeptide (TPR) repeat protein